MGQKLVTLQNLLDEAVRGALPGRRSKSEIRWVPSIDAYEYSVWFGEPVIQPGPRRGLMRFGR